MHKYLIEFKRKLSLVAVEAQFKSLIPSRSTLVLNLQDYSTEGEKERQEKALLDKDKGIMKKKMCS